jgi:hypothetical protein
MDAKKGEKTMRKNVILWPTLLACLTIMPMSYAQPVASKVLVPVLQIYGFVVPKGDLAKAKAILVEGEYTAKDADIMTRRATSALFYPCFRLTNNHLVYQNHPISYNHHNATFTVGDQQLSIHDSHQLLASQNKQWHKQQLHNSIPGQLFPNAVSGDQFYVLWVARITSTKLVNSGSKLIEKKFSIIKILEQDNTEKLLFTIA